MLQRLLRTLKTGTVLAASLGLMSACGVSHAVDTDTVTLKLTDFFPPEHFVAANGVEPFMDRVEDLSGGEITFEHYSGGQLVADANSVTGAETGLTDIAYFTTPYATQDLPLLTVCSMPNAFETSAQGISACDEAINTEPVQQSFDDLGVHYLWGFTLPPYTLLTADRELRTMEDIRGLKVQSSGGVYSDTLAAAGATPVEMAGGELYEALDRGTIDGSNLNQFSVTGYGITPLLGHSVSGINSGSLLSGFLMNDETWNELSPEHQAVIEEASRLQQESLTSWLDENLPGAQQTLEDEGVVTNEFEEPEAWADAVQPVWDEWVPEMEERGHDGQAVMDAWNRGLESYPDNG